MESAIMPVKRKRSSLSYQVCDSLCPSPVSSSTSAAELQQTVGFGEQTEMPEKKRRRTGNYRQLLSLKVFHWSSSSSLNDQTATNRERHPKDETKGTSFSAGRKRNQGSHGTQVLDSTLSPSTSNTSVAEHCHQPNGVGEQTEKPEKRRRRTGNYQQLLSLKVLHWSSSSGLNDQTATARERHTKDETKGPSFIGGRKRNHSSHGAQVFDSLSPSTSASVDEEHKTPVRKRRRTGSFDRLLSFKVLKRSRSSGQSQEEENQTSAGKYETSDEDPDSLQDPSNTVENHGIQKTLSSDLEVLPIGGQVHNPVSPDNILSRYEIVRMLGKGSYGSVYEAKRLEDGLEVAVKIISKPADMKYINIPGHPVVVPLEVGLLIMVNEEPRDPHIIQLMDWQDQLDRYIMVMEYPSPCQDLFDFTVSQGDSICEDMARVFMAQATMAADLSCRRGVFHRDIKLENLLINTDTLDIKLVDFGCGALQQESGYEELCGTPEYFPPEYYMKHKYHMKPSTVWSLGVLLFRLVCNRFPKFRDIQMINNGIWDGLPGLSNECCHMIQALLRKNPSQRIELSDIILHDWFTVILQRN